MKLNFSKYYELQKKYKDIFNKIFESYYENGYFGKVSKNDIKESQYIWFCRLVKAIETNQETSLETFISNHNNKITREYYSNLTGINFKRKKKLEVIELLKKKNNNV
jgi:RecG-like helicase